MQLRLPDARANRSLDLLLGSSHDSTLSGATVYHCLFVGTPSDNEGTGLTELGSGIGYGRQAVTNNSANWPDAASRQKSNGTAVTYGSPSGSGGLVTHWALKTASSAGSFIAIGKVTTPFSWAAGIDPPNFPVGSLVISN